MEIMVTLIFYAAIKKRLFLRNRLITEMFVLKYQSKKNTQARLLYIIRKRISCADPQKLRFENQQKKHQQHPK